MDETQQATPASHENTDKSIMFPVWVLINLTFITCKQKKKLVLTLKSERLWNIYPWPQGFSCFSSQTHTVGAKYGLSSKLVSSDCHLLEYIPELAASFAFICCWQQSCCRLPRGRLYSTEVTSHTMSSAESSRHTVTCHKLWLSALSHKPGPQPVPYRQERLLNLVSHTQYENLEWSSSSWD